MSDHHEETPTNSAIMLLPVVMFGLLVLTAIMYYGGINNGFYPN